MAAGISLYDKTSIASVNHVIINQPEVMTRASNSNKYTRMVGFSLTSESFLSLYGLLLASHSACVLSALLDSPLHRTRRHL